MTIPGIDASVLPDSKNDCEYILPHNQAILIPITLNVNPIYKVFS